jgi:hypothetical protein
VIATYAAALAICVASLAVGQAAIALCGARRWSWLSPAVGLALLCALCWATVRLPGDGAVSAGLTLVLTIAAVLYLRGRVEGGGEAIRAGLPVAALALLAASLPFIAEGHFGILGTGFNPDMSQHLLATDRLAHGAGSPLLRQGYPLGPHAVVAALNRGLGIGIVQGFDGLTLAAAVLAPLTALTAFADQPAIRRTAAALLVGLPYLVASYYAQGAFKETIQALLVLAFVLALRESTRAWRRLRLRYVPAAVIAIGSVYVYSFPGLTWMLAIAAIHAGLVWVGNRKASPAGGAVGGTAPEEALATGGGGGSPAVTGPAGLYAASLAVLVFLVGTLPELGRMLDFRHFETFDPNGPGLGNLFGQISPFTALGIWPSGDFRLAPGDGAVPAVLYYLGAAFAVALLVYGLMRCWRTRERAIISGATAVAALYLAARLGGTPYTAAKALEIAAPLLTLTILLPLSHAASRAGGVGEGSAAARRPLFRPDPDLGRPTDSPGGKPSNAADPSPTTGPARLALWAYLLAAACCSLLAFANAPVGPTVYSPALTKLRTLVGAGPTEVLAPADLLIHEHGEPFILWELRGGRVCVDAEENAGEMSVPRVRFVIAAAGSTTPPFPDLARRRRVGPYVLWQSRGAIDQSACPLIAVRQARSGAD